MPRFQFSRFILFGLIAMSIARVLFVVTTLMVAAALPSGPQLSFLHHHDSTTDLMIIDVRSGIVVPLTEEGIVNNVVTPAWSPDGEWIAYNYLS